MASIAIMVGGAVLNAAAFIGGNYLARALGGGDKAAQQERVRHDKALKAYQAAYARYLCDRTKLLDWIQANAQIKAEAKQNFTNSSTLMSELRFPKNTSSLISMRQASSKKMVNSCS